MPACVGADVAIGCNLKLAETNSADPYAQMTELEELELKTTSAAFDPRRQDKGGTVFVTRSERIYSQQDLWYFRTREDAAVGPFRYRSEAQSNLECFMERLKEKLQQHE